MRKHMGFTLVEILVVVVIIGMMAAMVAPKVVGRGEEARISAAQIQISELEQALDMYRLDNGRYPTTEQGLDALVKKPSIAPDPTRWRTGGYVKKVPLDPWGKDYVYRCPGDHGDFDLLSLGPNGQEGHEDITNWE